jgi:ATP-dependent Clp protease adaptor protein ClpS
MKFDNPDTEKQLAEEIDVLDEACKNIVLYNDDVNTFEFVIETLINVCKHDLIQAEQCAHLVHYKGKCSVKAGSYDELEPLCLKLLDLGLSAKIE